MRKHGKCKAQLAMVSRWLFGSTAQVCGVRKNREQDVRPKTMTAMEMVEEVLKRKAKG